MPSMFPALCALAAIGAVLGERSESNDATSALSLESEADASEATAGNARSHVSTTKFCLSQPKFYGPDDGEIPKQERCADEWKARIDKRLAGKARPFYPPAPHNVSVGHACPDDALPEDWCDELLGIKPPALCLWRKDASSSGTLYCTMVSFSYQQHLELMALASPDAARAATEERYQKILESESTKEAVGARKAQRRLLTRIDALGKKKELYDKVVEEDIMRLVLKPTNRYVVDPLECQDMAKMEKVGDNTVYHKHLKSYVAFGVAVVAVGIGFGLAVGGVVGLVAVAPIYIALLIGVGATVMSWQAYEIGFGGAIRAAAEDYCNGKDRPCMPCHEGNCAPQLNSYIPLWSDIFQAVQDDGKRDLEKYASMQCTVIPGEMMDYGSVGLLRAAINAKLTKSKNDASQSPVSASIYFAATRLPWRDVNIKALKELEESTCAAKAILQRLGTDINIAHAPCVTEGAEGLTTAFEEGIIEDMDMLHRAVFKFKDKMAQLIGSRWRDSDKDWENLSILNMTGQKVNMARNSLFGLPPDDTLEQLRASMKNYSMFAEKPETDGGRAFKDAHDKFVNTVVRYTANVAKHKRDLWQVMKGLMTGLASDAMSQLNMAQLWQHMIGQRQWLGDVVKMSVGGEVLSKELQSLVDVGGDISRKEAAKWTAEMNCMLSDLIVPLECGINWALGFPMNAEICGKALFPKQASELGTCTETYEKRKAAGMAPLLLSAEASCDKFLSPGLGCNFRIGYLTCLAYKDRGSLLSEFDRIGHYESWSLQEVAKDAFPGEDVFYRIALGGNGNKWIMTSLLSHADMRVLFFEGAPQDEDGYIRLDDFKGIAEESDLQQPCPQEVIATDLTILQGGIAKATLSFYIPTPARVLQDLKKTKPISRQAKVEPKVTPENFYYVVTQKLYPIVDGDTPVLAELFYIFRFESWDKASRPVDLDGYDYSVPEVKLMWSWVIDSALVAMAEYAKQGRPLKLRQQRKDTDPHLRKAPLGFRVEPNEHEKIICQKGELPYVKDTWFGDLGKVWEGTPHPDTTIDKIYIGKSGLLSKKQETPRSFSVGSFSVFRLAVTIFGEECGWPGRVAYKYWREKMETISPRNLVGVGHRKAALEVVASAGQTVAGTTIHKLEVQSNQEGWNSDLKKHEKDFMVAASAEESSLVAGLEDELSPGYWSNDQGSHDNNSTLTKNLQEELEFSERLQKSSTEWFDDVGAGGNFEGAMGSEVEAGQQAEAGASFLESHHNWLLHVVRHQDAGVELGADDWPRQSFAEIARHAKAAADLRDSDEQRKQEIWPGWAESLAKKAYENVPEGWYDKVLEGAEILQQGGDFLKASFDKGGIASTACLAEARREQDACVEFRESSNDGYRMCPLRWRRAMILCEAALKGKPKQYDVCHNRSRPESPFRVCKLPSRTEVPDYELIPKMSKGDLVELITLSRSMHNLEIGMNPNEGPFGSEIMQLALTLLVPFQMAAAIPGNPVPGFGANIADVPLGAAMPFIAPALEPLLCVVLLNSRENAGQILWTAANIGGILGAFITRDCAITDDMLVQILEWRHKRVPRHYHPGFVSPIPVLQGRDLREVYGGDFGRSSYHGFWSAAATTGSVLKAVGKAITSL